jgi:hypothetical protein
MEQQATKTMGRWRARAIALAAGLALTGAAGLAHAQSQPQWTGSGWAPSQPVGPLPGQWKGWRTDDPTTGTPPAPRSVAMDTEWQNQPTPMKVADAYWVGDNPEGPDMQWREDHGWHHDHGWRDDDDMRWRRDDGDMRWRHNDTRWAQYGMDPQWQNGVEFISGGVALDESRAFRAQMGRWPFAATFLGPGGEYLADVRVRITNGAGDTVIQTRSRGPFLLAKLPPGHYKVWAAYESNGSTKWVRVGSYGSSARVTFYFPAETQ